MAITPLKKRIETVLKTVIDAAFAAEVPALTCTVLEGHTQADKPDLPYLLIACDGVPNNEAFPAISGVKVASIKAIMFSDVDDDTETDIDNCLQVAQCAMEDLTAIQTETQANFTDLHFHLVQYMDESTDFEGENIQMDLMEFKADLQYITPPA